jgi:hypothetical protein
VSRKQAPAKARKQKVRSRSAPAPAKSRKVSSDRKRPLQNGGRYHGTPYRASQADYAKTYGKSLPTIKRWWKDGRPLDDPDAMGELLSSRGRKPGERVTMAGEPWERPDEVSAGTAAHQETPGDIPVTLDESFFAGLGFLAAIERLKKSERERSAAYFAAIRQKLPSIYIQNRFKEWICVIEPLRKLAKDEPEIRKANDLTVDKTEMDAAIAVIFNGFRQAARNLPSRAAGKLIGLTEFAEIVDILEAEIDVLFRALTKFTLDEAAAAKAAEESAAP